MGRRLAAVAVLAVAGTGVWALWPPSQPLNSRTACAYTGDVTSSLTAFARATGQPVNCAVLFNDSATTWDQWAGPWFIHPVAGGTDWARWVRADPGQRRLVITQELVPGDVPANWRVLGAQGSYDRYARRLAANLVAAGLGQSVIRLGHEMNTLENHDSLGSDPGQYRDWATYWARVVRAMRSVPGAHFLFDWNVNAGYKDIPLSSYYPGDSVVDIIGADLYDSGVPGNPAPSAARWQALAGEPGGLATIVAFARQHDKPLSFPEWGLVSAADGGGGDDPDYVSQLAAQIAAVPVVYQGYFDRPTGSVLPLQRAPRSLAAWKRAFGPGGPAAGHPW